jgi:heme iron utilization protein
LAAAEAGIIEHVNADHADAVAAIAEGLLGQAPLAAGEAWRMVAVDVDGADMAAGERVCRLHFSRPVSAAEGVRAELVRAARDGRKRTG